MSEPPEMDLDMLTGWIYEWTGKRAGAEVPPLTDPTLQAAREQLWVQCDEIAAKGGIVEIPFD